MFIAGHVAAVLLAQPPVKAVLGRRWTTAAGFGLLLAGVTVCTHARVLGIYAFQRVINYGSILPPLGPWSVEVGSVLIFAGVLLASPVRALLRTRPVQLLGRLSFPIYLLHWPIMITLDAAVFVAALPRLGETGAALLALAIGSAVTLGVAELFERYIDAPAVALSRRFRARPKTAVAAE